MSEKSKRTHHDGTQTHGQLLEASGTPRLFEPSALRLRQDPDHQRQRRARGIDRGHRAVIFVGNHDSRLPSWCAVLAARDPDSPALAVGVMLFRLRPHFVPAGPLDVKSRTKKHSPGRDAPSRGLAGCKAQGRFARATQLQRRGRAAGILDSRPAMAPLDLDPSAGRMRQTAGSLIQRAGLEAEIKNTRPEVQARMKPPADRERELPGRCSASRERC